MNSEPLAVHHLAVVVEDLVRAERFYGGVLRLPVERRWDDTSGRPRSVWFSLAGNAFLAVERAEQSEPRRVDGAPGWHCVMLRIPKAGRDGWRQRLLSAGFPIERETDFSLYVRDPDGGLVGLSHWPETQNS